MRLNLACQDASLLQSKGAQHYSLSRTTTDGRLGRRTCFVRHMIVCVKFGGLAVTSQIINSETASGRLRSVSRSCAGGHARNLYIQARPDETAHSVSTQALSNGKARCLYDLPGCSWRAAADTLGSIVICPAGYHRYLALDSRQIA
jgi:hypothetical protein